MLLHTPPPPKYMLRLSPLPTPSLPCPSLLPAGSSSPGAELCCFPAPCPQKSSPAPPSPRSCCLPAAFPHPAPPGLGQPVPEGRRGPQPGRSPPSWVSASPAPHPAAAGCAGPRTQSGVTGHVPQCHRRWDTVAVGGGTTPDPKPSLGPTAAMGPAQLGGTPGAVRHHLGVTGATSRPRARRCPRAVPASQGRHRGKEPEREVPPSGRSPPQVTEGPWTS